LTREVVLDAAWTVARRDGVDRLTMRRLADELGVMPNTLYSHVSSKSALLDELLDHLLGRVAVPDPDTGDWRDGLVELMNSARRVLLEHPELVPSFLARPTLGPNALRLGEVTFALLRRGGLEGERAVAAYRALLTQTLGSAAFEAPRRSDPDPEGRRARAEEAYRNAPEMPNIGAVGPQLARPATEETFETGLRWILAGIAAS
jgi:TetR/AcrR family tetracycline transcriptional repressor